ncbi:SGNH/GDSL hydrolase family protein [Oceanobacillus senegalensis]|uniref:SGNH/GDSL hydrolase family protein n=1 Tax=Oceanobacillus senegalensis TaxID=1936063 RepID=UPI000A308037|nr:SGNH/GDSL hydrolase family protein [Oceanobacillus senegalensis]
MKKTYFYTIFGTILLGIAMISIIFPMEGPDKMESRPALLKETKLEELQQIEVSENGKETKEPTEKEVQPSDPKELPERIAETVQGTMAFFQNNYPIHIVAVGDSLTQGVGDTTNQGGYVGILERTINTEDKKVAHFENFGKRGSRSEQLLERLNLDEVSSAISKADIILITIGANDIMQVAKENFMNLTLNDFIEQRVHYENNLKQIMRKIKGHNPDATIYLIGFYNPFEKYFQDIKELNMIVNAYNGTTKAIADENDNVEFIPTLDLFQDKDINLFAEDNFHPNYQGYHLIAERVLNYITNEES